MRETIVTKDAIEILSGYKASRYIASLGLCWTVWKDGEIEKAKLTYREPSSQQERDFIKNLIKRLHKKSRSI